MPCIRRKYHYGLVYLSPHVDQSNSPLCGQTVPVIKDGHWENISFGGFVDVNEINMKSGAIITGLTGYTYGEKYFGDWLELEVEDWLLGAYVDDSVYLVLKASMPILIGHQSTGIKQDKKFQDNVFDLSNRAL